jgi:lipoprotein-anchoring transpeptidase ErfK/SrfK
MQRLLLLIGLMAATLTILPAGAAAQDPETAILNAQAEATLPEPPAPVFTPDPSYRPTSKQVYVARLITRVGVFDLPGDAAPRRLLQPWIASTGNPVVLQILERTVAANGTGWLRVLLPSRPNGSSGWINEANVIVSIDPMRVRISLKRHTLSVYRKGRLVRRIGVALGAAATPTPKGRFSIYQEVREPWFSPLGPWALHLTAHSNVLFEYAGGPGRVAIHGARGELWAEAGTNPSHGCIRVPDPGIGRITALVRPGTPVDIVA